MSMKRNYEDDNNDDPVVSLQDIVKDYQELESTANAVLGGSDDQNCTYSSGYMRRQALYACSTCSTHSSEPAGVCLACSLECHDGHELFELYTKRNFRCDCGNSKFDGLLCKLCPSKDKLNIDNLYNHNFEGLYCICERPYPDAEDSIEDEMIQCIICEDWFHGRHLKGDGALKDYAEMICHLCMNENEFLWFYNQECISHGRIVVTNPTEEKQIPEKNNSGEDVESSVNCNMAESKIGDTAEEKTEIVTKTCRLKSLRKKPECKFDVAASFWPEGWRSQLCCCDECKDMLQRRKLEFLLKNDDTVAEYEKQGEDKDTTIDRGMQALGGMNRIQQVEMIQGYNDMKSELSEYLKTFAREGKVVTKEDINAFFQRMSQQKRQRVDVPHFCR